MRSGTHIRLLAATSILAASAVLAAPVAAHAGRGGGHQVRFVGAHPIPRELGGGICHIEAPHVHVYTPSDARLQYRDHDGALYFVGDPVAYGWDGPRTAYRGPHPIHVDVVLGEDGDDDVEYCYLDGPHFHTYAPPPVVAADFRLTGGAYWYVATPPPVFLEARPALVKVNAIYTPLVYERPVLTVTTPPPGWIGATLEIGAPAVVVAPPAVVVERPRAFVGVSAGVEVHIPAPTLSVEIGGPAVFIGGGARIDGRGRGKWKGHHDNGRHRGWSKH